MHFVTTAALLFKHVLLAGTCKSVAAQYECLLLVGTCTKSFEQNLLLKHQTNSLFIVHVRVKCLLKLYTVILK